MREVRADCCRLVKQRSSVIEVDTVDNICSRVSVNSVVISDAVG